MFKLVHIRETMSLTKAIAIVAIFSFIIFVITLNRVGAFDSSSTNFQIKAGDIESIAGSGSSASFKNRSAGGQNASGPSTSTSYKDYSGILYWLYVANTAPIVDNVQLNSQNPINLNEGTTESVSATADVYDDQGCDTIDNVTAKIYRSGVSGGKDCTPDNNNNCYSVASCTETSCVGTEAVYTCTIDMQFHADPTDGSAEYWRAWIEATDSGALTGSNYSPADAPDVITMQAMAVTTTIGYGPLDPGQNTGATNQETTVTNTGNSAIDVRLYGADMTWSGNIIDTANQEYSLSGFTYGAGTDLKEGPSYDDVNADLAKPTQSPSNSSDIFYWGLGVPSPMPASPDYTGTNTFEVINAL